MRPYKREHLAAMRPIKKEGREVERLSADPRFLALIEKSRARQKSEGGMTTEEVRRRLGLKPNPRHK